MALEEFENEPREKDKRYQRMRSIMDYGMGILWLTMGCFFMFPRKFGERFERLDDSLMKCFAAICIIYGLFRIYRAYKKNYFNER